LDPIESFDYFQEIEEYICYGEVLEFSTVVIVEFEVDCIEGLTFNDPQITELEQTYVSTYNSLSQEYCDPYSQTVSDAKVFRIGENTTAGNTPVEMHITGTCRGCDNETSSIYAIPTSGSATRCVLTNGIAPYHNQYLEDIETCYCPSQAIGERAPYEAELVEAYQEYVEALELDCIKPVGTCEVTIFDRGIVIEFEGSASDITSEYIQTILKIPSKNQVIACMRTQKRHATLTQKWNSQCVVCSLCSRQLPSHIECVPPAML
jgi:hypothetical protein